MHLPRSGASGLKSRVASDPNMGAVACSDAGPETSSAPPPKRNGMEHTMSGNRSPWERPRRRVRFEAEQLEGRTVLSGSRGAAFIPPFLQTADPHSFRVLH